MHRTALALLLLGSCRSPGTTARADDATPCKCPSCPPPTPTVASALPLPSLTSFHGSYEPILEVAIDAHGDIKVNAKKEALADVRALAAAALAVDPDVRAVIRADKDCKYGVVRAVLDQLKTGGIWKVGYPAKPP